MKRHILDEQVSAKHAEQIRRKLSSVVQLGVDWGVRGWDDVEQVIPHLQSSKATFHTLDDGFFKRRFLHAGYCIVYYEVPHVDLVRWMTRWLRHPGFNTHAKRLGKVVKVQQNRITYWDVTDRQLHEAPWS